MASVSTITVSIRVRGWLLMPAAFAYLLHFNRLGNWLVGKAVYTT
jgi:hypothetical protein